MSAESLYPDAAASLLRRLAKGCALSLVASISLMPVATAQMGDLRLPISLDADSTDYDGKTSMLMFEGLRLSQGSIGVQADRGLASQLDFEDSVWQFRGNVVIDTEDGRITCENADLRFNGHQLRFATITGTPATFEIRRATAEETTYAEAGRLDYDFDAGVVEFSEDAVISEGGNQISSNVLVYNIGQQRINAQSSGDGQPKVRIVYTPRPEDTAVGGTDDAEPASDTEPDAETDTDTGTGTEISAPDDPDAEAPPQ